MVRHGHLLARHLSQRRSRLCGFRLTDHPRHEGRHLYFAHVPPESHPERRLCPDEAGERCRRRGGRHRRIQMPRRHLRPHPLCQFRRLGRCDGTGRTAGNHVAEKRVRHHHGQQHLDVRFCPLPGREQLLRTALRTDRGKQETTHPDKKGCRNRNAAVERRCSRFVTYPEGYSQAPGHNLRRRQGLSRGVPGRRSKEAVLGYRHCDNRRRRHRIPGQFGGHGSRRCRRRRMRRADLQHVAGIVRRQQLHKGRMASLPRSQDCRECLGRTGKQRRFRAYQSPEPALAAVDPRPRPRELQLLQAERQQFHSHDPVVDQPGGLEHGVHVLDLRR